MDLCLLLLGKYSRQEKDWQLFGQQRKRNTAAALGMASIPKSVWARSETRCGTSRVATGLISTTRKVFFVQKLHFRLLENSHTNFVWTKPFTATSWKTVKINVHTYNRDDVNDTPNGVEYPTLQMCQRESYLSPYLTGPLQRKKRFQQTR